MKATEQVQDFHKLFEHPIGKLNELEPLTIRQLRIKLLFEELEELAEAGDVMGTFTNLCIKHNTVKNADKIDGDNVNKKEELDALCDLEYVLHGKINTSGLHEVFDRAFDLVHGNNMQKAHKSNEHAEETIKSLSDGNGYNVEEKQPNKFVLKREDGKVIKPHDHKKVDLSPLLA